MPARRPSYHYYLLFIHQDPVLSHYSLQARLCPRIRITNVCYGPIDEIDLWTESIIDADRQYIVAEKESRLKGSDGFSRERHMPAAVDHECYMKRSESAVSWWWNNKKYRGGAQEMSVPIGMGFAEAHAGK